MSHCDRFGRAGGVVDRAAEGAMEKFRLLAVRSDGGTIFAVLPHPRITGPDTLANLTDDFHRLAQTGASTVRLDLRAVEFIDGSFCGRLIELATSLARTGGRLAVTASPGLADLFRTVRLDRLCEIESGTGGPFGDGNDSTLESSGVKMALQDPEKRRTRRRLVLALLAAFVLLGGAGWLASVPDRIRPGMTREEVDARLGPPDGRMLAVGGRAIGDVVLVWKDRGIVIEFDGDNRVREVTRPPTLFDNLRSKFGL